jgi:carboxylate-amine ligase
VLVYCVHGHAVSRGVLLQLRAAGIDARFLRGGIEGWQASGRQAPRLPHEVLRAGLWRAARDGLTGSCPDPETGQLRPVHEILAHLRQLIEPELRRTGELPFVDKMLAWLKVYGGGANRQRTAYERTARLTDVVDFVTEQALRGI